MSYVIDTAHLQYQLSTQEGDIAQKWSGSLNAWKMIVDFKKWRVLQSVLIQTFDKENVFYPNFSPKKKEKVN